MVLLCWQPNTRIHKFIYCQSFFTVYYCDKVDFLLYTLIIIICSLDLIKTSFFVIIRKIKAILLLTNTDRDIYFFPFNLKKKFFYWCHYECLYLKSRPELI